MSENIKYEIVIIIIQNILFVFVCLLDIQSKLSIVMINYCFTKKSPWIENVGYPTQSFRLDMPVVLDDKRDYTLFF